ncbi:MAG TPA: thrombospondin type 3 repeat-containing protein [Gemmatimonadales bacterium]|nr:thrombospondin type 3 repeat-containing protein [Gemmatimonadales bacterium]
MRAIWAVGVLTLGSITTLAAQRAGDFELGLFGAYTKYDNAFNLDAGIGGGARLAYYVTSAVGLGADVIFNREQNVPGSPGATMDPLLGSAEVIVRFPALLYAVAGYSRIDFGKSAPFSFTDGGLGGGLGVRLPIGPRVGVTLEGRAVYTPSTNGSFGQTHATHFLVLGGLSFLQTGAARPQSVARGPKDSDGDGVPDKRDACPNTPLGATVDVRGCPADSDQDAVYDGIDKCPGTPAGAKVDATGCPLDADHDGVADGLDQCPDTPAGAVVNSFGCPTDADGDGVPDGLDKCPDTPRGATVDATGCPKDSDGDGVADGIDKCPDTPVGATVDANGCPKDADNDGVPDGIDKCPNTPVGATVDATGCPLTRDSDGDGVPDNVDRCPGTPAGSKVDQFGCVVLFREERTPGARPTLILRGVNFETGRSVLTAESFAVLDQVAGSLVANPEIQIEIAGYTDNTGSALINRRLSNARAFAVRAYLARKGVAPSRMTARGYGPASPVATNATTAGRAQNRRVELHKLNP